MANCLLDSCCCCVKLRVGCFIIGYLSLIGSIVSAGSGIATIVGADIPRDQMTPEMHEEIQTIVNSLAYMKLINAIIYIILSVCFVNGLHQNKPGQVKGFLIANVVSMCLGLVAFIIVMVVLSNLTAAKSVEVGAAITTAITAYVITMVISIYFLLVIRSYYYKMLEENKRDVNNCS